ncbi:MAG: shikimate kinase [Desulfovibrionaceae bacterium]|jgi:shikimate kinase|nr:shikimate kinase [Desulfovibrionaceae bacterium]
MIFLIGMPGSGKSTVGRALARRLRMDFADSDHVIEQRLGCTIRGYFDQHGEAAFRDIEETVIDELTRGAARVLATGGGAVLRPANRQRLHERGTVIYLRSSPEQLHRRLRQDTKRPLLQVADPLQRLRDLYAARDPLYRECAHFVVDTHGVALTMLVDRVLMQLELGPVDAIFMAPVAPQR